MRRRRVGDVVLCGRSDWDGVSLGVIQEAPADRKWTIVQFGMLPPLRCLVGPRELLANLGPLETKR